MIVIKNNKSIILNIIIFIIINFVASNLFLRIDLTDDKKYSLNDETKRNSK